MKISKHIFIMVLFVSTVLNTSCRKEETEFIQEPDDEILLPNSVASTLLQRTAMNDGSNDNIIDGANCFNIQLPVNVTANGTQITVNSESDYDTIENIFDASDDDTDSIQISFPIVIVLNDFTQVTIDNLNELNAYASTCNGENQPDDDIECVDFQYPITVSLFNVTNELLETITISSDNQLYNFIDDIHSDDLVTVNFPITVVLSDDTQFTVNTLSELEDTIENYMDDCDEDDDNDYNDDDCDNCTPNLLEGILTGCSDWIVDKLERDDHNYDNAYDGYLFNFLTNGTIVVDYLGTPIYGTWSISGSGNNMMVLIDIPSLPYCNLNWNLHEIEQNSGETKVDLRVGDDDRMRYESTCN